MAEYANCSGCGEVMTPVGCVCIDCAFPVKRDREQYVQRLREELSHAAESLRDRFAVAAFPVAAAFVRDSQLETSARLGLLLGSPAGDRVARGAYQLADAMIAARRPASESSKG